MKNLSHKNTQIYQDLFVLENIFREYIKIKNISESDFDTSVEDEKTVISDIKNIRGMRVEDERLHHLDGKIVADEHYLNYTDLSSLSEIVDIKIMDIDKKKGKLKPKKYRGRIVKNTDDIRPIRNSVMHTNEITDDVLEWSKIEKIIDYVEKLSDKSKK